MRLFQQLKHAGKAWSADHVSSLAAAIAYHAIFSLAPLFIVLLALIGLFYEAEATQAWFLGSLGRVLGKDATVLIQGILEKSQLDAKSGLTFLIGAGLILVGSIGVFTQLQEAVNRIWHVAPSKMSVKEFIKHRVLLFVLVLIVAGLMMLSLMLGAMLEASGRYLAFMTQLAPWMLSLLHGVLAFGIFTLLFGVLFKRLPDTLVSWRSVWVPAVITTILFIIGRYVIGLYLAHGSVSSLYGAAGSLVILLLWLFYAAQIFLIGVELVKVSQEDQNNTRIAR